MEIKCDKEYGNCYIDNTPKAKSKLTVGEKRNIVIFLDTKFNKIQKKMWKFLLNINIEDINK